MDIAVTGGNGKLGRVAMHVLRAAGHRVTCFDREGPAEVRFVRCDLADFGQVMGALTGVEPRGRRFEAVLHLAGIPAPGITPDEVVFRNNTMSTYNVFSAAARLGIRRVVWASSETVLGLPFDQPPAYVPIDEQVSSPNWAYALSKHLGEAMAEQYVRWHAEMSILSLRFSNIIEPRDYEAFPGFQTSARNRRMNLWGYVDVRDAAEACRLALESAVTGHEAFVIAAADTCMERPSAELMAEVFPAVPARRPLAGRESLLSIEKAARVLGYAPKYSWTTEAPER